MLKCKFYVLYHVSLLKKVKWKALLVCQGMNIHRCVLWNEYKTAKRVITNTQRLDVRQLELYYVNQLEKESDISF